MYSLEDNHESDNWQDQTTTTRPNKKAYESTDNNYTKKYKKKWLNFLERACSCCNFKKQSCACLRTI